MVAVRHATVSGTNNPAYEVSKTVYEAAHVVALPNVVQEISADFTSASDSAWHDVTGMTGIALTAGTWIAFVNVDFACGSSAGPVFRVTDGSTTYAQKEVLLTNNSFGTIGQSLGFTAVPFVLGGSATMKLQVFSDTAITVKKFPVRGGDSTRIATNITFLQIAT